MLAPSHFLAYFHAKTRFSLLLNQCLFQSMKIRSTITGSSQTSQDASQQSAENLPPQFRLPPQWHEPARGKTPLDPLLANIIHVL